MNYKEWNDVLIKFFFGEKDPSKNIILYMTKEKLISLYDNDTLSDEEKWKDFVKAVNETKYPFTDSHGEQQVFQFGPNANNLREKLEIFLNPITNLGPRDYPYYLTFLILMVMAKTETEATTDRAYYNVITDFFNNNNLWGIPDTNRASAVLRFLCGDNGKKLNFWKSLSSWCKNGNMGILNPNPIGKIYVGTIKRHCPLSKNKIDDLPRFFVESNMTKDGEYSPEEVRRKILARRKFFNNFFINHIQSKDTWHSMVEVVLNKFNSEWEYEVANTDTDSSRKHYTTIPLHLCMSVTGNTFDVHFRVHASQDVYQDTILTYNDRNDRVDVVHERDGWSRPIPFGKPKRNADRSGSKRFAFREQNFYVLHPNYLINEFTSRSEPIYNGDIVKVLVSPSAEPDPRFERIEGLTNASGFSLYSYTFNSADGVITENAVGKERDSDIKLEGGLFLNRGQKIYFSMALPKVVSMNSKECFPLLLCSNEGRDIELEPHQVGYIYDSHIEWVIPEVLGTFSLCNERKDKEYARFSISRENYIDFDASEYQIHINRLGKVIKKSEEKPDDVFFSSNSRDDMFKLNDDLSRYLDCAPDRVCKEREKEQSLNPSVPTFEPAYGDRLIDWLYNRGRCSKSEFTEAFYFFQDQYCKEDLISYKNFPNNIKTVLHILKDAGFIEEVDGAYIVPCRPRFIPLPIHPAKGTRNFAKLVGCRSISMIQQLKEQCGNYPQLSFQYNKSVDNYFKFMLSPSVVYVELKGNDKKEDLYGFRILRDNVCFSLGITNYIDFKFSEKMKRFIPDINDLGLYDWKRLDDGRYEDYVFDIYDPERKVYENANEVPVQISELAAYKTKQNISLIKTNKGYRTIFFLLDKNGRQYKEIADESLGKLYVIHEYISNEVRNGNAVNAISDIEREIWKNECIAQTKEQNVLSEICVMKRTSLPLLLYRFMNIVSFESPYRCETKYRSQCIFQNPNAPCQGRDCPHKYYLYNTDDTKVDMLYVNTIFSDKFKFKPKQYEKSY